MPLDRSVQQLLALGLRDEKSQEHAGAIDEADQSARLGILSADVDGEGSKQDSDRGDGSAKVVSEALACRAYSSREEFW